MIEYEATIAAESDRFVEAIRAAAPDAPVPTCPDWTVADLAWHLTEVHAYWAGILESEARTDEEAEAVEAGKPARPETVDATLDLFDETTGDLLTEFLGRDDDEPAWFWLDTARTVGAIRRMQAHEATMHRVDAELAAGLPSAPIDPALAADGVAHAFEVMWAWWGTPCRASSSCPRAGRSTCAPPTPVTAGSSSPGAGRAWASRASGTTCRAHA